jgi:glycosyltransferase involved in cell wall biosynthesis
MATVSVLTPTYNRADVLPRAIRSVREQTYDDVEHVIVDDGSTDGTDQVVADHDHPGLRYVRLADNAGVAAAQNRGLEAATGEYVSFLDSDDEYLPRRLAATVDALASAPPEVGGVFTAVVQVGEHGRTVESVPSGEVGLPELAEEYCINASSSTLFRASVFDRVGDFDEQLQSTIDYDLHLRVAREFSLLGIDEVLSRKYDDVDGIRDDYAKVRQGERRFLRKHGDVLTDENVSLREFKVGRAALRLGDAGAARRWFRRSMDHSLPPEVASRRRYWIGWEWLDHGDAAAAAHQFAASRSVDLPRGEGSHRRYLIGRAWLEHGHERRARRDLLAAMRAAPTNYRATALLAASLLPVDGAAATRALHRLHDRLS